MIEPTLERRRQAWSSYWASGVLHSCSDSYQGNYAGAIGAFWEQVFAGLRDSSRLLDLATGNGALPLRAWERFGTGLLVEAVDLADVAPAWYRPQLHTTVNFRTGVAMESLPFEDASFDCVTSQYGLEYAQAPQAWQEMLRVVRDDGCLALVMHHADSVLCQVAREEQAAFAWLLGSEGLLEAAEQVAPWLLMAKRGKDITGETAAAVARQAYNAAMQAIQARIERGPAAALLIEAQQQIHGMLSNAGSPPAGDTLLERMHGYRTALQAAQLRGAELLAHAMDAGQMDRLLRLISLQRPRLQVRCQPLLQEQGLLGWALRAAPTL
jgi:ubiquinone/menaquinone biosynthesis C-methylase UbiE